MRAVGETVRMAILTFKQRTGSAPKRIIMASADKREMLAEYRRGDKVELGIDGPMEWLILRAMKPGTIIVDAGRKEL